MPHDKEKKALKVGDTVTVEFKVKAITGDKDFCNVTLETCEKMPGNDACSTFSCNSVQCCKSCEDEVTP